MHKLDLSLNPPTYKWERHLPEYKLFNIVLTKFNVEETGKFIDIIDEEVSAYKKRTKVGTGISSVIANEEVRTNGEKILETLNSLINEAPLSAGTVQKALLQRCNHFFEKSQYMNCVRDCEMYIHISAMEDPSFKRDLNYCDIIGTATVCYYYMGCYADAKRSLVNYNKHKGKQKKKDLRLPISEIPQKHLHLFEEKLKKMDIVTPSLTFPYLLPVPYKGFNKNKDITLTSDAVQNIPKNKKGNTASKLVAKEVIPEGSVVLVEDSVLKHTYTPYIQCEFCFSRREAYFTCLQCRIKTYCSVACMYNDQMSHLNECPGYEYLTLLMLDSVPLFRMFLKVSINMSEKFFQTKPFQNLKSASAVWEKLLPAISKYPENRYLALITARPPYEKLSRLEYATMIVSVFRFTIFVERKTCLIKTFYNRLGLTDKEKLILLGSIAMRLHVHLYFNTIQIKRYYPNSPEYITECLSMNEFMKNLSNRTNIYPVDSEKAKLTEPFGVRTETELECNLQNYIKFKKENNKIKKIVSPRVIEKCENIEPLLNIYNEKIWQFQFIQNKNFFLNGNAAYNSMQDIALSINFYMTVNLSDPERLVLFREYVYSYLVHFINYFVPYNHKYVEQVFSLYAPNLFAFQHSCVPNIEIIIYDNGTIVGKTLKTIQPGEELCISRKAHFQKHSKKDRLHYLKKYNISCKCDECVGYTELKFQELCLESSTDRTGRAFLVQTNESNFTGLDGLEYVRCLCKRISLHPLNICCRLCKSTYDDVNIYHRQNLQLLLDDIKELKKQNASQFNIYTGYMRAYNYVMDYFGKFNEYRVRVMIKTAKYFAQKNFGEMCFRIIMDMREILERSSGKHTIWMHPYTSKLFVAIKILLYNNIELKLKSLSNLRLLDLIQLGLIIARKQFNRLMFMGTYFDEMELVSKDFVDLGKMKKKAKKIVHLKYINKLDDYIKNN